MKPALLKLATAAALFHRCRWVGSTLSITLVMFAAPARAATVGTWTAWATGANGVPQPGGPGTGTAQVYIPPDRSRILLGYINSSNAAVPYGLWSSSLAAPNFNQYSSATLSLASPGYTCTGIIWTQAGTPSWCQSNAPGGASVSGAKKCWVWNGTQWVNPTITGGAETLASYVQLSDGSILMNAAASGAVVAFRSTDGGLSYTQQGSMSAAWAMPGATTPGLAPLPGKYNLNGTPNLQPLGSGAIYQIALAPGGELFASGEAQHSHSLDDGKTWLACYDAITLPLRNNPGVIYPGIDNAGVGGKPVFPNPHVYFFPGHAGGSGSTRTGEEALALENIAGGGFYLAAGFVNANTTGAALSGQFAAGFGDTCSTSGETLAYGLGDRHAYSWDGTQWTQTSQTFNNVPGSKVISGDGYNAYYCVSGTLWKYTPNPAAVLPPHVQAGTPRTVSLNTQNWVDLTGVITVTDMGSEAVVGTPTCQWIGRGPGPVVFDAPESLNPKAYFSVPGDYALNMRVTHPNNGLFGGSNVIVHVTAKTGGLGPTITTQPINAVLAPNAQFSVTATGTGLKYQWRRNGTDLRDIPGAITGAQTSMLTLLNPTKNDESGIYHCLVYSDYGRTESYAGQLGFAPTVNLSDQLIPSGQTTTLLTAIGDGTGPLTVEWRDGSNNIVGTNPTYPATPGTYTAKVTNIFGMATASATVTAGSSPGCTVSIVYTGNNTGNPGYAEPRGTYGTFNYKPGTSVAISAPMFSRDASPDAGFHRFIGWLTTGGTIADPTSPHTTLTLPATAANLTVTAQYAATAGVFALTVVNGTGSRLWQAGDTVNINALDAPPGMQFSRWVGDSLITTTANVNNSSPSFVMPAGDVKITALYNNVPTGVEIFRTTYGLAADGSEDLLTPAGDGVANLLKYAFNLLGTGNGQAASLATPNAAILTANGSAGLPLIGIGTGLDSGKLQLTYIRRKGSSAPGVSYAVQFSNDLGLLDPWDVNPSATTAVSSINSSLESVTVTDSVSGQTKRFVRVKLTSP